jgi:hypothetical protein
LLRNFLLRLGCLIVLLALASFILPARPVEAYSTSVKITKYYSDGTTVIKQKTLTYQWMEENLPVLGDGVTHYYHQGPVFIDDPDPETQAELRWNSEENSNIQDKDMGAIKGTNLKDLCDLVGGMDESDELKLKAEDGFSRRFAYQNVYDYSSREGPMVLAWYKDGNYPDSGYSEGMRLIWLADNSVNPEGLHVFGNNDWQLASESKYWYYYQSGNEKYPTTTGLSVQKISEISIYSSIELPAEAVEAPFWDLNEDHICNSGDLVKIGMQWNLSGTPGWIKEDVNTDGNIDIGDIVTVGKHWGETW